MVKGYYASIGRNKACGFDYFKDFDSALKWILNSLNFERAEFPHLTEFDMTIKEIEVKVCTGIKGCTNLIDAKEFECLSCEGLKADAYLEAKEQKEAENDLYPEKEV